MCLRGKEMKRGYHAQPVNICALGLIGLIIFAGTISYSQETDAYYVDMLKRGEKSFLDKNYDDAVQKLEIAAFGLLEEKKLRAKAYIYLSLCYYYQNNTEKSEKYLRDAANLAGEEGLASIEIDESASSALQELMDISAIGELERKIESDPNNDSYYFELFELYKKTNNLNAGRKTIQSLLEKNPVDAKAYHLLGMIFYKEQNYVEATKNFEKIFELAEILQIDQNLLAEAGVYLTLSVHHQGDRKRALTMIAGLLHYFTEEKITSITEDKNDRATLQNIIENHKRLSKTDKKK